MAKPPKSTPHSDIDGVHRDERPNTETVQRTGETSADLKLASDKNKARPRYGQSAKS